MSYQVYGTALMKNNLKLAKVPGTASSCHMYGTILYLLLTIRFSKSFFFPHPVGTWPGRPLCFFAVKVHAGVGCLWCTRPQREGRLLDPCVELSVGNKLHSTRLPVSEFFFLSFLCTADSCTAFDVWLACRGEVGKNWAVQQQYVQAMIQTLYGFFFCFILTTDSDQCT